MSVDTDPHVWFEQLIAGAKLDSRADQWLAKLRHDARAALQQLPIPHRKQEAWRYTWIDALLKEHFISTTEDLEAIQAEDIEDWVYADKAAYRFVFANGRLNAQLSNIDAIPEGVRIGSLRKMLARDPKTLATWFGQTAKHTQDVFTALNTALLHDGLFIQVRRGAVLDRPIEVVHINLSVDDAQLITPRHLIVLEPHAQATLVERFISTGDSLYFYNAVSEVLLEEGAQLTHHRIQNQSQQAYHLHKSFLSQANDSHYQATCLSFGSVWARDELQVNYIGEGAQCHTDGLSVISGKQHSDFHLDVTHAKPRNTTIHNYKSIVGGSAHMVFDGRIYVAQDAQLSDAQMTNNNLLLSRKGEVDTKPQLEIYADDVKCSHGSTVGQLDEQQLFYLRSRGVPHATATRMLCQGFAVDIIDKIQLPEVHQHAMQFIEARLSHAALEMES